MTRLRPQRVALVLVLAFSALLELYRLSQNGWANVYYSAAVKSMLGSLHNFFFVSSDPGGLVSVDKPPLGLWLQTVSAAIFGFHPLSMLVPEALCAIAAVGVMYLIVAPRFGAWAGVAAAAALATFPSFVASGRDNNLDALLILLMALACLTGLRAIETGSWRWLVGTAVLVGLAFNTKTLAAYLIVPGIAIGWMVCAPGSLPRRSGLLAGATVVLALTSLVWLVAVDATPASQRPYVGGTVDNSELSLSFGHNGFGRVLGERNSPTPDVRVIQAPGSLRLAGALSSSGAPGPLRLFDLPDGDQGAWLLLFALAGLVALALALRGGGRRNPQLALAFVMGGWFAVEAIVLSVSSGIVHPYYVSALGPGTAAMVGAGAAAFVTVGRRGRLLLLLPAVAMIATVGVTVVLLRREHDYLHWFWPVLAAVIGVAIVAMLWRPRVAPAAIAVGLAMLLVVPAIYCATVWQVPVNGTFPTAGPYIEDDTEALSIPTDQIPIFRQLLTYVRARDPGSRWDVLTQGATTAAPLTLLGGRVAALGGYGTIDPVLTPAQLAVLVERGEVRFVALGGGYASNGGNAASTAVSRACREIPAPRWRSPQNIDPNGPPVYAYERGGWNLNLFDCTDRTAQLAAQG
ncbi:MAG: glycosyltransferase family 39 protein [Solirubrobacteraceae bacterium]|jgi:4-amino-4-deoxy-L-arabinose transferase-like glycosyltransferase